MNAKLSRFSLALVLVFSVYMLIIAGNTQMNEANGPSNLKAEHTQDNNIQLTWNAADGASQYAVYRATVTKKTDQQMNQSKQDTKGWNTDYSKLDFRQIATTEDTKYVDKTAVTDAMGANKIVYYVTAKKEDGSKGEKSNYAEVKPMSGAHKDKKY